MSSAAADGAATPVVRAPPSAARSLTQQVLLARFWLPVAIVGVVLLLQLAVVPLGGARWQFWTQLLFYSLVGPVVTFVTLTWIARQARFREQAQAELTRLYTELRESHELLGSIQAVTEQFAGAQDPDAVLDAAARGVTEATGALGAAVRLGSGPVALRRSHGLDLALEREAARRDEALTRGESPTARVGADGPWVLTAGLSAAGELGASVFAFYRRPPVAKQRESFRILAAEFSAAAEAARSRMRDLLTLFDVDRSVRAEGNLDRLLETLLTQMVARVGATHGGVYLVDEERLVLQAAQGEGGTSGAPSVRFGEGIVGRVAEEREPCIVATLSDEDRAAGGVGGASARSAVALPLRTEAALLGVVVLVHPEAGHFDEASLPFLGLLAGQVSLAVRNARAYLQSEELAIAEERARIAREIHDGVAQSLAFAALKLDLVDRLIASRPAQARIELAASRTTIREMIKEVRRSIFALRPVDLERYGFVETVRRYCVDFGQQNDVQVELDLDPLPDLGLKSEAVLFRIFQEAMHNVAKHADARTVRVELGVEASGRAFLRVGDDGRGFDLGAVTGRVTSAGGLGLKQMHERVAARGGEFCVDSDPGRGTEVYVAVPA